MSMGQMLALIAFGALVMLIGVIFGASIGSRK